MVNFGGGLDEIDSLSVFSDSECQTPAAADITSSKADNTPAQCVSQKAMGDKWGSVMQSPVT